MAKPCICTFSTVLTRRFLEDGRRFFVRAGDREFFSLFIGVSIVYLVYIINKFKNNIKLIIVLLCGNLCLCPALSKNGRECWYKKIFLKKFVLSICNFELLGNVLRNRIKLCLSI